MITGNVQVYTTQVKYINFYCLKDGEWSALGGFKSILTTKRKLSSPKGKDRSGHRLLLPKGNLTFLRTLVTLEKSYHSVLSFLCVIGKLGAIRSHFRPHQRCSVTILCMPMENWTLSLFRQCQNRVAKQARTGRHKA